MLCILLTQSWYTLWSLSNDLCHSSLDSVPLGTINLIPHHLVQFTRSSVWDLSIFLLYNSSSLHAVPTEFNVFENCLIASRYPSIMKLHTLIDRLWGDLLVQPRTWSYYQRWSIDLMQSYLYQMVDIRSEDQLSISFRGKIQMRLPCLNRDWLIQ